MVQVAPSKPVGNTVAKINDEVAIGEDLVFQERWWRFERIVWICFTVILVLDLAVAFGRGPLAKAERKTSDGTMEIRYERIERTGTPSMLHIGFGANAIHNGEVNLFVSESVVNQLGNQRIIPSPQTVVVGDGGLTYAFPASVRPASVDFALQPLAPGIYSLRLQVVGAEPVEIKVLVIP